MYNFIFMKKNTKKINLYQYLIFYLSCYKPRKLTMFFSHLPFKTIVQYKFKANLHSYFVMGHQNWKGMSCPDQFFSSSRASASIRDSARTAAPVPTGCWLHSSSVNLHIEHGIRRPPSALGSAPQPSGEWQSCFSAASLPRVTLMPLQSLHSLANIFNCHSIATALTLHPLL